MLIEIWLYENSYCKYKLLVCYGNLCIPMWTWYTKLITKNPSSSSYIFLNDMLWFIEKTDICKFADDNTIYSCAKSVNGVIENLQPEDSIKLV